MRSEGITYCFAAWVSIPLCVGLHAAAVAVAVASSVSFDAAILPVDAMESSIIGSSYMDAAAETAISQANTPAGTPPKD